MTYQFSQSSKDKLRGVHSDLVKVANLAISKSDIDFKVIEGVRSKDRQAYLFKQGATKTMNSRHLTGHAIDIVPVPLDWKNSDSFKKVADAMFSASKELKIPIRWGGDWNRNGRSDDEKFYDGPHFELLKEAYP